MEKLNDENVIFNYHKISISCLQHISELKNIIQHEEIKIRHISLKDNRPTIYKSSIELVAPSDECLNYLASMEGSVIKGCKISYIELARDTRHVLFSKAYVSLSKYSKTLRKKYSGGFIYDGSDKEKNLGKGLVSDSTYYYGTVTGKEKTSGEITINITGKFKFVMYAKISPIDCFPYAHEEWRISNAGNIFKRTGIRTIKDLLIINKGKLFGDFENKFLTHYTINQQKLGMYLHGLNRCRKPSKKIEMRSQLLGAVFCSIHKIQTANDLVSYCMKEKKRIKSKVGRKSKWENRILHINYSMVQDAA